MNKLFQLTLLTAALSTCSSHAGIRTVTKFLRLFPLFTQTSLKAANPTIPPQRCFQRKKPTRFAAEVVPPSTWYTFRDSEDAEKIIKRAQQDGAKEVYWFEIEKKEK